MKKKLLIVALFITCLLMMMPYINTANAEDYIYYNGTRIENIDDNDKFYIKSNGLSMNDVVTVIVELNGNTMLENSSAIDFESYISTFKAQTEKQNIAAYQENALKQMEDIMNSGYTLQYNYSVLINGFAISMELGDMYAIRKLDCVKNAYVAPSIYAVETEAIQNNVIINPMMQTAGEQIGANLAYETGYTGANTVVAILDTGFDIKHEAFSGAVINPKLSRDDVINIISQGLFANAHINGVYKSEKMPYAYDYADNDADVLGTSEHGQHVAGIAAGNSENFNGIAKDAQLLGMKVFKDIGGSDSSSTIAALEDCVSFGVDAINMSLGISAGMSKGDEAVQAIYSKVEDAGIVLMISAGNDGYQGANNMAKTHLPYASSPDYGVAASPSIYTQANSVGSVNNSKMYTEYIELSDGNKLSFNDNSDKAKMLLSTFCDKGKLNYIMVGGVGNTEDYSGINVSGKIAVVKRGTISFQDKMENAVKNGAIAMICYNDKDNNEIINMSIANRTIPCVFVSYQSGQLLSKVAVKTLEIKKGVVSYFGADLMSGFSAWGCSPDLRLKPDISGPGGNIYSCVYNNQYAVFSGTSMSSPALAGSAAVIKEYVNEKYPDMSNIDKAALVNRLIMSTAVPVVNTNGVVYSPRNQGAGLINIYNAITTPAYIRVDGINQTKIELGDNLDGKFEFAFTVVNMSSNALTYIPEITTVCDETKEIDGLLYCTLSSKDISDKVTVVFKGLNDGKINVEANGEATITVSLELMDSGKEALNKFINGTFLEGFITLKSMNGNCNLNLVYMGFYGDWTKADIFEPVVYSEENALMTQSAAIVYSPNMNNGYLVGVNNADYTADKDKIYFSYSNMPDAVISCMMGLRRNIKQATFSVYDDSGTLIDTWTQNDIYKSFYYGNGDYVTNLIDVHGWDCLDENGKRYPDGTRFTYKISATLDYDGEMHNNFAEWSFDFEIDSTKPVLEGYKLYTEEDKLILEVNAKDNNYLQYVRLYDATRQYALGDYAAITDEEYSKGDIATIKYDITDIGKVLLENGVNPSKVTLEVADYANNTITETIIVGPQVLKLEKFMEMGKNGIIDAGLTIYPKNYNMNELVWSSSDESIVEVNNGVLHAKNYGTAVIRVESLSGLYSEMTVRVTGDADTSVSISNSSKTATIGDSFRLTATVWPSTATDRNVKWSSADENIAIVDENGNVTAVGEGSTIITATSKYGNKANCIVTVNPIFVTEIVAEDMSVIIGEYKSINVSILPENATHKEVGFMVIDSDIIRVDENGIIYAEKLGTATVKITAANNITKLISVTVVPVAVTDILLNCTSNIIVGTTRELSVRLLPENATIQDVTYSIEGNAAIIEGSTIKGINIGSVKLIVTAHNGLQRTFEIFVSPVYATEIVAENVMKLRVGETKSIVYSLNPQNATFKNVSITAENNCVSVDDNGSITGVSGGSCNITLRTINNITKIVMVEVEEIKVSEISIILSSKNINKGQLAKATALVLPGNNTDGDIVWSSSDETIVIIDENGIITAINNGNAVITATVGGVSQSITITVSPYIDGSLWLIISIIAIAAFIGLGAASIIISKKNK